MLRFACDAWYVEAGRKRGGGNWMYCRENSCSLSASTCVICVVCSLCFRALCGSLEDTGDIVGKLRRMLAVSPTSCPACEAHTFGGGDGDNVLNRSVFAEDVGQVVNEGQGDEAKLGERWRLFGPPCMMQTWYASSVLA